MYRSYTNNSHLLYSDSPLHVAVSHSIDVANIEIDVRTPLFMRFCLVHGHKVDWLVFYNMKNNVDKMEWCEALWKKRRDRVIFGMLDR